MSRRVLITASSFGHIKSFHLPYIKAFSERGWQVHIACGGAEADIAFADACFALPFKKKMSAPENFKAAIALHRLIKQNDYRLIICHTSLAAFFTRLALFGLRSRPKLINVVHGYLFDDSTPALKRFILKSAEKLTAAKTDLILTMNSYDFKLASDKKLAKRVEMIPGMGVDADKLFAHATKERPFDGESFILVYPAEFSDRKNQKMLIRALPKLPERIKLVLPGTGAREFECRALAAELNVAERVAFPGFVDDIGALLRCCDAAVSASRSEGLPFNILEAMLLSLPVIASNVKGNSELIEDGVTGFLFEYDDTEGFVKAVNALAADGLKCRQMGEQGRLKAQPYVLNEVMPMLMDKYLSELK